jgi:ABC-type multidrug transport system fused ATPase/permease subunit
LSTVRKADKIIVIEKGVVVESGTHEELMAMNDGLYRSLSRLQYQGELI